MQVFAMNGTQVLVGLIEEIDVHLHLHHHNLQIQSIHQAEVHDLQVVAVNESVEIVILKLKTMIVVVAIIAIQGSKNVSKTRGKKVVNVEILTAKKLQHGYEKIEDLRRYLPMTLGGCFVLDDHRLVKGGKI